MKNSMAQRQESPQQEMGFKQAISYICSLKDYNKVREALNKRRNPDGTKLPKKEKEALIETAEQAAKEIAQAKLSNLQNIGTFFPNRPTIEKEKKEILSLFKAAGHLREWKGMKGMGEGAKIRQQVEDEKLLARIEKAAQCKIKQMPYLPPSQFTP